MHDLAKKALVIGIKSYMQRARKGWADHRARTFASLLPVATKEELLTATRYNGNTGNFLIGEGAAYAVGRKSAHYADFGFINDRLGDEAYLKELRGQFDVVVFVTANLVRWDYDAAMEARLLKALALPIVILGIGCQRVDDLPDKIPEGTRQLVKLVAETDGHVFTRGKVTADYMRRSGVRNVWPTGCPSLFIRPEAIVAAVRRLKALSFSDTTRVAFSGYLGTDQETVRDIATVRSPHGAASYILQDEYLFHKLEIVAGETERAYDDFAGRILAKCRYKGAETTPNLDYRVFFNNDQWRGYLSGQDFCFGRRFHGVVSGLQAGIPGILLPIDDRMMEMIEQLGLPHITRAAWGEADDKHALIEDTAHSFDADTFEEDFMAQHVRFRQRLADIGLGE